jgi:hypothetical protein
MHTESVQSAHDDVDGRDDAALNTSTVPTEPVKRAFEKPQYGQ